jgi:hypothetical protein
MTITPQHYVPLLRWRMGEYQALEKLGDAQKDRIVPLLEVLPPDYDFEQRRPKKDIDEQLKTFGDKLKKKWDARPALLDGAQLPAATRMADGRHPMTYLFDEARQHGTSLTPVLTLESDAAYRDAVRLIDGNDLRGAALRCTLEEALDPDFDDSVETLLEALEINADSLDIVLDLKTPAFDPQASLVAVLTAALTGSTAFGQARSVTIMATSFPDSMTTLKLPIQFVPRREWVLYKALVASLGPDVRRPTFGDYGVAAITFAQGDMRFMRGSPNVRYAVDDGWLVAKAKREKGGSNAPYPGLCASITASGQFKGSTFSAGGAYIEGCSTGVQKRGNPTVWKWVATNHHITKVVDDLATLPGA